MGFRPTTLYQHLGKCELIHTSRQESQGDWIIYSVPCLRGPAAPHDHDLSKPKWGLEAIADYGRSQRKGTLTLAALTAAEDGELMDFFDDENKTLKVYIQFVQSRDIQAVSLYLRM